MKANDFLGIFGYMCLFGFIFLVFWGTGSHSDNEINSLDEQDVIPSEHRGHDDTQGYQTVYKHIPIFFLLSRMYGRGMAEGISL